MIVFLLLGLLVTTWSSSVTSQKIASSTGQEEGTGAAAAPTAGSTSVDVGGGVFLTPASIIEKEARGPNRFAYSVNLLVGLNSTLSITTLNSSKPVYWALAQRLANSSVTRTTQLYMLGQPNIRDDSPVLRATYQCAPKETDCTTMTVNSVKLNSLGDYSYQTFVNTLDSLYVDYNVSAWVQPLDFQCGGSIGAGIEANLTGQPQQPSLCAVNRTLGLFSVLGSNRVTVTCSILVAQNEVYEPQADVVIRSVEDNTECSDTETTQVRIIPPFMAATILGPLQQQQQQQSSVNSVLYRLSRNCTRIFTKAALNSRLTCSLQPRAQAGLQTPAQLRPTTVYTSVSMTMDVQYAPEYSAPPSLQFNRTMIVNSSSPTPVFTCPFESNPPPQFEWRVSTVVVNSSASSASSPARRRIDPTDFHTSGKDYIIQRDLEVGLYGFECRARTLGLVNKYSDTVKFYLNVIPVPVSSKKASQANVGAIVGGVIGGVLAILVIVLLVLFLIRRHRNGLKDESEKAKELDIGINDNNPHLSSRSNLSTAGLTSGPATTTSSSASSSTNGTTTTASVASHMNGGVGGGAKSNGIGHKAIAGLMVPSSTAQSYAAIAHAAAAAAAQQNRNIFNGSANGGVGTSNINGAVSGVDQPNGVLKHTSQSYNNPGFFESTTSYTIPQNHLESPPPYDSALHNQQQQQQQSQQPAKKDSSMMLQNQQKDYMGSNSRLLGGSGSNTPTLVHKNPNGGGNGGIVSGPGMPQSHSYSNQLGLGPATPSNNGANSLQQMQYPGSGNLQYTTVQNLARNRQPLSGTGGATVAADMDPQSATQYTTMTQLNPIDV